MRRQLRHSYSRIRREDHYFLLYSLLDSTTDALFPVLEWVLKRIQQLDDELEDCSPTEIASFNIAGVRNVRKQLNYMHQMLRPMKEVLLKATEDMQQSLPTASGSEDTKHDSGGGGGSGSGSAQKYMRDVYSHLIQILEDIEAGKNECRDLSEVYNIKITNKQSDVLYVLTFVTIFIAPIQVMSGIYGMNFVKIPELEWESGYAYFWSLSLSFMVLLAAVFVRMGWLEIPRWC